MPLHDPCCKCDFCRMIGGCLQFDWGSPGTAADIEVRLYNLPPYALSLGWENGVPYTLTFNRWFSLGDSPNYGLCQLIYAVGGGGIGGLGGTPLMVIFTARTPGDIGGPCMDVVVTLGDMSFWPSAFYPIFTVASGTCGTGGIYSITGSCGEKSPAYRSEIGTCESESDFNINLLCRCAQIKIGDDYASPEFTRALITTCPGTAGPPESYDCVEGVCVDPVDGTGSSDTLEECVSGGCDPPYPTDCSGWTDCTEMDPLNLTIIGFENCSITNEDYTYSVLNRGYVLDWDSVPLDAIICDARDDSLTDTPNWQVVWGNYWGSDAERLAELGDLVEVLTVPGSTQTKIYVAGLIVRTTCTDGRATITGLILIKQQAIYVWNGTGWDFSHFDSNVCDLQSFDSVTNEAPADPCGTGGAIMSSLFNYDKCGTPDKFSVIGST